jgi:hypothetical protein
MRYGMKESSSHKEQKKSSSHRNRIWHLLAKALGEKSGKDNKEADKIAFIRLLITLQILITNFVIIYGVIRTHHFPGKSLCEVQNQKQYNQ